MKKSFGPKTLIYPTPVWLIGTYDAKNKANIATVAWGGVCSSEPPALAVSLRKSRQTYDNILRRGAFTVNVPSAHQVAIADFCGIYSGKSLDKFNAAKITAVKAEWVDAPYIEEFPMVLECELIGQQDVGSHTQFIGKILDVKVDEAMVGEDGLPDMKKIQPVVYAPEKRSYYGVGMYLAEAFHIGKKL